MESDIKNLKRSQWLTYMITQKDSLIVEKRRIEIKLKHLEKLLSYLNDDEKEFIRITLIDRPPQMTKVALAVRFGMSEGGIRYKIKTILIRLVRDHI